MKGILTCLIYIQLSLIITSLVVKDIQEVIIIGAGLSGLRASQILIKHNIPHLILQSTDHIGGRITSMPFEGLKVDEGASFIHDSQNNNSLGKLVTELGWPTANGTCSFDVIFQQNKKSDSIQLAEIAEARKIYFQIVELFETKLENQNDISISAALNTLANDKLTQSKPRQRMLVEWMFAIQGNIDGAQINDLSAKQRSYKQTKNDITPIGGFHQLLSVIFRFSNSKIEFNQKIVSIDYTSDPIKIETKNRAFYAKKVISSLPLGVLKAGIVKFNPPLPVTYQNSIKNIGFGVAQKLFVSFNKPYWGKSKGWMSYVTKTQENKYPVAFIVPGVEKHMLIFFVSGAAALKMSNWTEAQIKDDLQDFLIFFHKISKIEIKQVKMTHWHTNDNYYGSYSHYKVGTKDTDFSVFSQPINNKLWFTGEHTHQKLNSYSHGAYIAGENTALKVINTIKTENEQKLNITKTEITKPIAKTNLNNNPPITPTGAPVIPVMPAGAQIAPFAPAPIAQTQPQTPATTTPSPTTAPATIPATVANTVKK